MQSARKRPLGGVVASRSIQAHSTMFLSNVSAFKHPLSTFRVANLTGRPVHNREAPRRRRSLQLERSPNELTEGGNTGISVALAAPLLLPRLGPIQMTTRHQGTRQLAVKSHFPRSHYASDYAPCLHGERNGRNILGHIYSQEKESIRWWPLPCPGGTSTSITEHPVGNRAFPSVRPPECPPIRAHGYGTSTEPL